MKAFAESSQCLMQLVTAELDDPTSAPCGRCANCVGEIGAVDAPMPWSCGTRSSSCAASHRPIEPRKQGIGASRAERGRAGALDLGRRRMGRARPTGQERGRSVPRRPALRATADMIRSWRPALTPRWVTAVPSLRHPELVPDFAQRVAEFARLAVRPRADQDAGDA